MIKAKLHVSFIDARTARAVDQALAPDNVKLPEGMKIKQIRRGRNLLIEVSVQRERLESLTATLDEFVSHIQTALGVLK